MRILGSYSPFLEPRGLDEAFIDMTGFESIYCPAAEVAAKIKGRIEKELNVIASVGIASSKVVANPLVRRPSSYRLCLWSGFLGWGPRPGRF